MRIPLLILGSPSIRACPVRLSAGKYKFQFENVTQDETNLPAEVELIEPTIFHAQISPSCTGKNINIFAERIDD